VHVNRQLDKQMNGQTQLSESFCSDSSLLRNDFSSKFLDLHGLHVDEAIAALQDRLCNTKGVAILDVVNAAI